MTVSESLAPIAHDYVLPCPAEDAFETYVTRIAEWWDPRYTANAETLEAVTIEPRVGGRVYATHADIGEDDWGAVTVWEPARRLVHTFTLAQDPAYPSECLGGVRARRRDDLRAPVCPRRVDRRERSRAAEVRGLARYPRQVRRTLRRPGVNPTNRGKQ